VRDGAVKLRFYGLDGYGDHMVNLECARLDRHVAEVAETAVKNKDRLAVDVFKHNGVCFAAAP